MKALWKNINGLRMVALQTLMVMILVLIAFASVLRISSNTTEVAAIAIAAAVVAAAIFIAAIRTTVIAGFAAVFIATFAATAAFIVTVVFPTLAVLAIALAVLAVAVFISAIAADVAEKYNIRKRFVFYIYSLESIALFFGMTIWSSTLSLVLVALTVSVAALLAESKLRF